MIENDFSKGNVCRHILMQAVQVSARMRMERIISIKNRLDFECVVIFFMIEISLSEHQSVAADCRYSHPGL